MSPSGPGAARRAIALARALVAPDRRQAAVAVLLRPANLFQPHGTTALDRYPAEFAAIRDLLDVADPAILSFGCSSGEELLTLRQYFPTARIHGVDVNPLAVRTARRRVAGTPGITVARGGDASAEPAAAYDVVLALAVFRHADLNPAPERCDPTLRFADFERTVTGLDRCLRPGGLLLLRHANFRFADCAVAAGYDPVLGGFPSASGDGVPYPVYGPDDRLLDPSARDDAIYRKRSR